MAEPNRVVISRVVLELFEPNGGIRMREEPVLMVERLSAGELERLSKAVELEAFRRALPQHFARVRRLQGAMRAMNCAPDLTVAELLRLCEQSLELERLQRAGAAIG